MLETIKNYIKDHAFEFKIMAIGLGVSFAISLAITGDFAQAVHAMRHRR